MQDGILLGIVTWIIVGAVMNAITKDVMQSFAPATVVALAVFGWSYYQQNKGEAGKARREAKAAGPAPIVTAMTMPEAFGAVRNILTQSHFGQNWWQLRNVDPEAGQIQSVMTWKEYFGDHVGEQNRQVVLTITFMPGEGNTQLKLDWDVQSPLNRAQANQVIEKTTAEIKAALC